jgi:DtxR family Mn-dependent transcriptional regulator
MESGILFTLMLALLALVFWPRFGVAARLRRASDVAERIRGEDAVKHLFTAEAARRPPSVESLAGAIGVSRGQVVEIVRNLERLGLARLDADDIVLTEDGRAHALRIVRTHRIWERYLADRTGVEPGKWHAEAERLEHGLAPEEVDRLAASMGDPLYDPHGDPIPTASGALPPARGVPIVSLRAGEGAWVVHVEDEPEEVYRSLRDAGIDVGSRLKVEGIDSSSIRLLVEGQPVAIDSIAARNLTVERLEADMADAALERLDVLVPGEEAVVVRVGGQVQGPQRRRLLDLGIVPGTVIGAELSSASGDPVAYRIRGAVIALRRAQAQAILIRRRAQQEAA